MDGGGARKPFTKWTADTEAAFLMALRLCGQPKKAAAEIGRSPGAAYRRRGLDSGFRTKWDAAIAEQQREWIVARQERLAARAGEAFDDMGGGRLAPGRERAGGWDSRKRGLFLRTLRRTKRVVDACAAAGLSESSAYYLRSQSPRFAAAWEKALAEGALPSVMSAVLERAIEGWDEPVFYAGKLVGHRRRFSEGLLRDLARPELERRAGNGKGGARVAEPEPPLRSTEAELDEAILGKLALLAQRLGREDWERWQLSWFDPEAARRPDEEEGDGDGWD